MANQSRVLQAIRESGLVSERSSVLALISGGADSTALLHGLATLLGRGAVAGLHVNHELRDAAEDDQRFCEELCRDLGVNLHVERAPVRGPGNVEGRAREARYRAAEAVRAREGLDWIATGHTASDNAETILYRLVSSPGRRALLGISPRRGRLIRPLLAVWSDETRRHCREAGLAWREDESNRDRSFARNRLRLDVLPELRKVHPAADANLLATAAELREEGALLDDAVAAAIADAGAGGMPPAIEASRMAAMAPVLRRLVLRRLAEQAASAPVALDADRAREIERVAERGGTAYVDLGGGVRAVCEYGLIRFTAGPEPDGAEPVELPVPGSCRFGHWEVFSRLERPGASERPDLGSLDEPLLDAHRLRPPLIVRRWSKGDRMRPLGLDGTKSLQDLFTDRKVPRSLRHALPLVESGGEIAWVAGVAVSEAFKVTSETEDAVRLRARSI